MIEDAKTSEDFLAHTHAEDQQHVREHGNRIMQAADNDIMQVEYRLLRADGTWIWCHASDTVHQSDIDASAASFEIDPLPTIRGYQAELQLLFRNLISNAIKYRKPGVAPVITIKVAEEDHHWHYRISDNGIGIAKAHQKRIFHLFQRLHRQDDIPGTGIGLVHCRRAVELHGGNIWLESEAGQGSTFHFTLMKRIGQSHEPNH